MPKTVTVALRKESVDRNGCNCQNWVIYVVALRKESVDRNTQRRDFKALGLLVALRKESVDRNMWWGVRKAVGSLVALRKESVDRNRVVEPGLANKLSRSPQGERG